MKNSGDPKIKNPFKPGAGHMPPYMAGREKEANQFKRLLVQETVLENFVLTGLRGLGKTVLLETLKPMAIQEGWLWAGTDLSESTSISEENLATRVLTDVSVVTSTLVISKKERSKVGLDGEKHIVETTLSFAMLRKIYDNTPGLVADKLKAALEVVWHFVRLANKRGIVFAYDEAQNLAHHRSRDQYPLSLLLDVFQSVQRKGIPFMLALVGLPTLFPKLVEARTFSERMFRVVFFEPLTEPETIDAVKKPIETSDMVLSGASLEAIWQHTHGYPYFVQYVCRELYDIWVQSLDDGRKSPAIPLPISPGSWIPIFSAGRWARATDRQRELLGVISGLPRCDSEFTVQEIVESSTNKHLVKPFGNSHVDQMLVSLGEAGLTYRNRHGKYSFALPLLWQFIRRQ